MFNRRTFFSLVAGSMAAPRLASAQPPSQSSSVTFAVNIVPPQRGPQPLPSPYPPQPGFALINSLAAISAPGNYQLTADQPTGTGYSGLSTLSNIILDAGGHSIAEPLVISGTNVVLKNMTMPVGSNASRPGLSLYGSAITVANSTIGAVYVYGANGVVLTNNLIDGAPPSATDDVVLLYSSGDNIPITGFQSVNNIIQNCYDAGIEGVGAVTGALFQNNQFANVPIAMGGWYDVFRNSNFRLVNCMFQGNACEKATVVHMFDFGTYAEDDASASADFGANGPAWLRNVQPNTFSGDSWY
jgi:hypothetical protein